MQLRPKIVNNISREAVRGFSLKERGFLLESTRISRNGAQVLSNRPQKQVAAALMNRFLVSASQAKAHNANAYRPDLTGEMLPQGQADRVTSYATRHSCTLPRPSGDRNRRTHKRRHQQHPERIRLLRRTCLYTRESTRTVCTRRTHAHTQGRARAHARIVISSSNRGSRSRSRHRIILVSSRGAGGSGGSSSFSCGHATSWVITPKDPDMK